MIKLLLKALFGIILIVALGIAAMGFWVVSPIIINFTGLEFKDETAMEHALIYAKLEQLPQAEWQAYIAEVPSYFELSTSLISTKDVPDNAELDVQISLVEAKGEQMKGRFYANEDHDYFGFYPTPDPKWQVRYEEGDSELTRSSESALYVLLVILFPFVLIFLAMIFGLSFLAYAFSRPVLLLEKAILAFAGGDTGCRIDVKKAKAINKLAGAFNKMADQLADTLLEQRTMIAAIPHELRGPISRMRFALDTCRHQPLEKIAAQLERIDGYSYELEQAVEDILLLSQLDQRLLVKESVDAKYLLQSCCASVVDPERLELHLAPVALQCHRGLLLRAVENVLDNAARYAQSIIVVRSWHAEQGRFISVENDGASLSEEQLKQLFKPFYRTDESRTRQTGGIGIGLTLVKKIIENQGGEVRLSQPSEGRFLVTLSWPH